MLVMVRKKKKKISSQLGSRFRQMWSLQNLSPCHELWRVNVQSCQRSEVSLTLWNRYIRRCASEIAQKHTNTHTQNPLVFIIVLWSIFSSLHAWLCHCSHLRMHAHAHTRISFACETVSRSLIMAGEADCRRLQQGNVDVWKEPSWTPTWLYKKVYYKEVRNQSGTRDVWGDCESNSTRQFEHHVPIHKPY